MSNNNQSLISRIYPNLFMIFGFLGIIIAALIEERYILKDLDYGTSEMYAYTIGIPAFILMITGAIVSKMRRGERRRMSRY